METNALKTLWTECFGNEDRWIDTFLRTAFDPAHLRMLTRQDRPAAALVWMDAFCGGRKLAYLYGIATHPDFRGQGLCRELMTRTHRELARLGYAGTILVPADSGLRQMYKNMGYENFGGIRKIPAQADDPISVRKISPEEYASLRREYLPAGKWGGKVSCRLCGFVCGERFPACNVTRWIRCGAAGKFRHRPGNTGDIGAC